MFIKPFLAALSLAFFAGGALAESGTCTARAAEKKLAGAAKTSFLTKCEKDATAACNANAMEKKLAGAAKNSFTNKCIRDAVGAEKKPA
jgi:hypothetical protein